VDSRVVLVVRHADAEEDAVVVVDAAVAEDVVPLMTRRSGFL